MSGLCSSRLDLPHTRQAEFSSGILDYHPGYYRYHRSLLAQVVLGQIVDNRQPQCTRLCPYTTHELLLPSFSVCLIVNPVMVHIGT